MITGIDMDFFGKPTVFIGCGPEERSYWLDKKKDDLAKARKAEILEEAEENITLAIKVLDYYGINPIEFINDLCKGE